MWISLEFKQVPYQYIEIDPYKKPKELTDINPRGLVPALKHGEWGCYESTVLMEYVGNPPETHIHRSNGRRSWKISRRESRYFQPIRELERIAGSGPIT